MIGRLPGEQHHCLCQWPPDVNSQRHSYSSLLLNTVSCTMVDREAALGLAESQLLGHSRGNKKTIHMYIFENQFDEKCQ